MTEVMLTSGQGFEGYEIVEYLGFVNVQSVLSSNFFKGFAAGVSEMSDSESEKLTGKLEQVNETALKRLQTIAARKKADAVIGVELNYTQFASYSVGTIASGTAVRLKKKPEENPVTEKSLYVSNYYNRLVPRPVRVWLRGSKNGVTISTDFFNYNKDDIRAIRADVELTNLYEERLLLKDLDFVFEKGNVSLIESKDMECKLPAKDILLLKDATTSQSMSACRYIDYLHLKRNVVLMQSRSIVPMA